MTRTQLSLFVPAREAALLDALRRRLDPVQASLIPAHVTLCRGQELEGIAPSDLAPRLEAARAITLGFGAPVEFDGHGILLPCTAGESDFAALRERLLGSRDLRRQVPHLTLAHPRNPREPGDRRAILTTLPEVLAITFARVQWIEQTGSEAWRVLEEFDLRGA